MIYQLVHKVGDGSWNLSSVINVGIKGLFEEDEEREGEAGHPSPDHPWPVHQQILSWELIHVVVPHCSIKSNNLVK